MEWVITGINEQLLKGRKAVLPTAKRSCSSNPQALGTSQSQAWVTNTSKEQKLYVPILFHFAKPKQKASIVPSSITGIYFSRGNLTAWNNRGRTLFQNSLYTEHIFMGKVRVKAYCPSAFVWDENFFGRFQLSVCDFALFLRGGLIHSSEKTLTHPHTPKPCPKKSKKKKFKDSVR